MLIRPETPEDFAVLYAFVQAAFSTARVSNGEEQDFVDILREGVNYIPDLALLAEEGGRIAAHIMFTRTYLSMREGRFEALLLAPVTVREDLRNRGRGSALVREGLKRAAAMGFEAVFLVGDPDYYSRLGFRPVTGFGIRHNEDIPERYVMALELKPGALAGLDAWVDII